MPSYFPSTRACSKPKASLLLGTTTASLGRGGLVALLRPHLGSKPLGAGDLGNTETRAPEGVLCLSKGSCTGTGTPPFTAMPLHKPKWKGQLHHEFTSFFKPYPYSSRCNHTTKSKFSPTRMHRNNKHHEAMPQENTKADLTDKPFPSFLRQCFCSTKKAVAIQSIFL